MDALERVKENSAPVVGGRRVASIAAGVVPDHRERARLEAAVAADSSQDDDPLAAHWNLINWYIHSYPQGPPPKPYAKALETAARAFRKDKRYANDVRFVSIWIKVAVRAPEPEDVFKYLQTNKIGQQCAPFYEEYAGLLEARGRFSEADAVYMQGITCGAAPHDKLKRKHDEFQHRMMMPQSQRKSAVGEDDELAECLVAEGSLLTSGIIRPALSSAVTTSIRTNTGGYSSFASSGRPTLNYGKNTYQNAPPAKLEVFKDTSDKHSATEHCGTRNEWEEFGSRASQTKENTAIPEKWTNLRLTQQQQGTITVAPKIEVFRDDNAAKTLNKPKVQQPANILAPSHSEGISKSIPSLLAEEIDDERMSKIASVLPLCPIANPAPKILPPALHKTDKFAFNMNDVYRDWREYSFEEIRAQVTQAAATENAKTLMNQESTAQLQHCSETFNDDDDDAQADLELAQRSHLSLSHLNRLATESTAASKSVAVASPTINTKAALAEVYEVFNADIKPREYKTSTVINAGGTTRNFGNDYYDSDEKEDRISDSKLHQKPEWYDLDADETISKQVYKTTAYTNIKSDIFVDKNEPINTSTVMHSDPVKIHPDNCGEVDKENSNRVRKPLGAKPVISKQPTGPVEDPQSPFVEGFEQSNCSKEKNQSPSLSRLPESRTLEAKKPQSPIRTSLPTSFSEETSLSEDYIVSVRNHEPYFPLIRPTGSAVSSRAIAAEMTPIPEVSFEIDCSTSIRAVSEITTIGGLSTIRGGRVESLADISMSIGARTSWGSSTDPFRKSIVRDSIGRGLSNVENSGELVLRSVRENNKEIADNKCENDTAYTSPACYDLGNPCNPFLPDVRRIVLRNADVDVDQMAGFIDCTKFPEPPHLGKLLENALSRSGLCQIKFRSNMFVRFRVIKHLGNSKYVLAQELKSGLICQTPIVDEDMELENDDDDDPDACASDEEYDEASNPANERLFVLNAEMPGSAWEFYSLKTLRVRLSDRILESIPEPMSCHMLADASCSRFRYVSEMSILNAIQLSGKHGFGSGVCTIGTAGSDGGVDELLVAFWTIELLRTVEAVHVSGFLLGGHLSVENVFVRLLPCVSIAGGSGFWNPQYDASGKGGWSAKGVFLLDWMNAVDLFAFPEEQMFVGGTDNCWESVNHVPCKYEPDWFAVASIVHWLLFGKELEVCYSESSTEEVKPIMKIQESFKRQWNISVWTRLFDVLLNLQRCAERASTEVNNYGTDEDEEFVEFAGEFPPAVEIRAVRKLLEQWLTGTCSKAGRSLKSLLQRVEMAS
ncbi:hypothetical protein HDU83_007292, partial [Entophlyctis luteolus]